MVQQPRTFIHAAAIQQCFETALRQDEIHHDGHRRRFWMQDNQLCLCCSYLSCFDEDFSPRELDRNKNRTSSSCKSRSCKGLRDRSCCEKRWNDTWPQGKKHRRRRGLLAARAGSTYCLGPSCPGSLQDKTRPKRYVCGIHLQVPPRPISRIFESPAPLHD